MMKIAKQKYMNACDMTVGKKSSSRLSSLFGGGELPCNEKNVLSAVKSSLKNDEISYFIDLLDYRFNIDKTVKEELSKDGSEVQRLNDFLTEIATDNIVSKSEVGDQLSEYIDLGPLYFLYFKLIYIMSNEYLELINKRLSELNLR